MISLTPCLNRAGRRHRRAVACFVFVQAIANATAFGQASNEIVSISPDTAPQGTVGLVVTFNLDTDLPAAPPAGVLPNSVTIGSMVGTSATHPSQYVVTATFDIPNGEPVGAKDAVITYSPPEGTLTFSAIGGFTVTASVDTPPSIVQQPQSQSAPPGSQVNLSVVANGTEPLSYQWQLDDVDIIGATNATYTINPVSAADEGAYRCVVTNDFGMATSDEATLTIRDLPTGAYFVVDTAETTCYDDTTSMTCPAEGQPFYGQDGQYLGRAPSYAISGDGLTVHDNTTGLTWTRSPDTNGDGVIDESDKLSWVAFGAYPDTLNAENFGGYNDWRRPTIKELYSLMDFRGTDPSSCATVADCPNLSPFIDTTYFDFGYGDTDAGRRVIDAQFWSSTEYVSTVFGGDPAVFGVNFADGRIKGYPRDTGQTGTMVEYVRMVRGNPDYGVNDFVDNGDGTVTDLATGLMWQQDDSGSGLNWQDALAYAEGLALAGRDDWRLPNAKELQSILDYTRSPDTTSSAAIDPVFSSSTIVNELGQTDFPFYWSSTTHVPYDGEVGAWGAYVSFGRAMGYMNGLWMDVHGAGAQRSDPKVGNPADYPTGHGPQGDAVRIFNYVRAVRDTGMCLVDADCDDGLFCTGVETCVGGACQAGSDPCGGAACDEQADACVGAPIPAVSDWGLIVLAIVVLTAGTLVCVRRRSLMQFEGC